MREMDELLAEHAFFKDFPKRYFPLLAGCATNTVFKEGEYLFRENEDADRFYLIRAGHVSLRMHAPGQRELIIETAAAGEVLGWSWLIEPHRWHFDGLALETTRAISLDGECLRKKCEEDHQLGYEFLKRFSVIIAQRLQGARMQLLDVYGRAQ